MAERKESSVLFSLRELRSIEEERIAEEDEARRRAEEERVRAQMNAERAAYEAEENKRRAVVDAERFERDRVERIQREEGLRLEEAERRARVDAQARIEEQRLAQEMHVRSIEAHKKRPVGLIVAATALVLVAVGLGIFLYQKNEDVKAAEAENQALIAQIDKTQDELDELLEKKDAETKALINASDEERAARQAELDRTNAALAEKRAALANLKNKTKGSSRRSSSSSSSTTPEEKKPKGITKPKCDPSEPLCGI